MTAANAAMGEASPAPVRPDALPRGAGLTLRQVNLQLHFTDDPALVYVQNNKAACSSIKNSILKAILPPDQINDDTLHARRRGPFSRYLMPQGPEKSPKVLQRPIFTVVRNPYARILSGYLDKLRASDPVGRQFHSRYFLEPKADDERMAFADFLRCIATEHPRPCNPHFAPQYVNTLAHHVDFDFIGSVEDTGAVADFLRPHGIALEPWLNHATRAATRLDAHFSDEAVALADTIFAADFELFGYPAGVARAGEPPQPQSGAPRGAALRDFVVAPHLCEQPEAPEIEALRRFKRAGDPAEKRAIAAAAVAFDDRRVVKHLATGMLALNALDVAGPLLDRLTLLLTAHMDHIPAALLSEQGLTMKRRREEILAR